MRAAEFELGGRQPGVAQAPATTPAAQEEAKPSSPVASAPTNPQAPETPLRVPRSWEEFVQMAACAPPAGVPKPAEVTEAAVLAGDRPEEGELQAQLLNERIRLLEAKLGKWQRLVSSFEQQNTAEISTTAQNTMNSAASMATETVVHGGDPPVIPPRPPGHESATIVQGPWSASRGDDPDTPAVERSRREPGGLYEAQVQRVTMLEQTFESFDKLMDGLVARLGAKGQSLT